MKSTQRVAALLTHPDVEKAAASVGISAKTLLRWMKEAEFDAAYRKEQVRGVPQRILDGHIFAATWRQRIHA